MKNKLLFVVAALVMSTLVFAAIPRTKAIEHVSPEKFFNLLVEPRGDCTVNFGALSNVALGVACRESSACTVTGAVAGDACLASTSLVPDDGGWPAELSLECRTATDAIYFRACSSFTDAGTVDPPSGTFYGRVIH